MDGEDDTWFDRELAACSFVDERLNKRLRKLVAQIGAAMGQSIPLVCQDSRLMSVWPVAIQTRLPHVIGIIGAPEPAAPAPEQPHRRWCQR
jgi:hypothetical protein